MLDAVTTAYDDMTPEEHEEMCEYLDSLPPVWSWEDDLNALTTRIRFLRRIADEAQIDDQVPF